MARKRTTRKAAAFDPADLPLLLPQVPSYISVFDCEARLLWSNRVGFGLCLDGITGKRLEEMFAEVDTTNWYTAFARAVVGDTAPFRLHLPLDTPPGHAQLAGTLGPARAGNTPYILCAAQDVSDEVGSDCPLARLFLSPLTRRVVTHLASVASATGGEIAVAMGMRTRRKQAPSALRGTLKHLLDRGVISKRGRGYSLTPELRPLLHLIVSGQEHSRSDS